MLAAVLVLLLSSLADEATAPRLRAGAPPPIPAAAAEGAVEGDVVFRATVDPTGAVKDVKPLRVPAPGLGFEAAVESAVLGWQFEPGRTGGQPITSTFVGRVSFSSGGHLPTSRARIYRARSAEVWRVVRELLAEQGLKAGSQAEKDQLLVTRWAPLQSAKRPDLPEARGVNGMEPVRFQLHVFVSPFVEPAHVHLGSVIEFERRGASFDRFRAGIGYGLGHVEEWFFGKLEDRLGEAGKWIPRDLGKRTRLARTLLGESAGPCVTSSTANAAGRLSEPEKLRESEVEIKYPGPERDDRRQAKIQAQFTIAEDGAVFGEQLLGAPPSEQFSASALGALSLLRYRPTRIGDCPLPSIMTYTVTYKLY